MDTPAACVSFTFAVEKIIGVSVDDKNTKKYHVQWTPTWISGCNLRGCEKLINEFLHDEKMSQVTSDVIKDEPPVDGQSSCIGVQERNSIADVDEGDGSCLDASTYNHRQQQKEEQDEFEVQLELLEQEENREQQPQQGEQPHQQAHIQQPYMYDVVITTDESFEQQDGKSIREYGIIEEDTDTINLKVIDCMENKSRSSRCYSLMSNVTNNQVQQVDLETEETSCTFPTSTDMVGETGHTRNRCPFCSKTFIWKGDLNRHVKIHTNDRRHKCSFCEKTFVQRSNMVLHERTHTNERPYSCLVCGKAFKRINQLNTHKYKNH